MNKDYFASRRTVRKFSDRPVSDELLKKIVDKAVKAPTTGNMQLYSVIATRQDDKRRELAALHFNQPAAANAPVLLTICADHYRFNRWCEESGAPTDCFDNLQGILYGVLDAVIFAQQIVSVAENEGLGTCYLGTVTFNAAKIAELLKLPSHTIPVCALAVGYPDGPAEETERIGSEGVLHIEEYPEETPERIKKVYAVKDNYPANKGYVAEHKKESLAQVFTDVRYPKGMNEEFSGTFLDFIRRQYNL